MTSINLLNLAKIDLHGFRTSTSKPGHHQTAIACLAHTLEVDLPTVRVLNGLRKQRNLSDYDGELVKEAALQECLRQAQRLVLIVVNQLGANIAAVERSIDTIVYRLFGLSATEVALIERAVGQNLPD